VAPEHEQPTSWGVPGWLRTVGLTSWLILGIAGALALGAFVFAVTRGVSIPLIVATVVAAIFVPFVDWLEKHGVARWLGSLIVTIGLLMVAVGTGVAVVWGIADRADLIGQQLEAGIDRVRDLVASLGLDQTIASRVQQQAASSGDLAGGGILSAIVEGLSGAASFLIGAFIAINILFFLMKDAHTISAWVRAHVSSIVATTLLAEGSRSLRAYFRGRTIVGAASAVTVTLGALVLQVPLAATIGLVTFVTSYIPYIGAIVSGAFAVLVALGEGGLSQAVGILIVVIFANAVVENLVTPLAVGATLHIHPLVILVVTILGGIVAGFVGTTLAAPLTAIGVQVVGRLRAAGVFSEGGPREPVVE
jgi:predicted PurR-regulated permease PerM